VAARRLLIVMLVLLGISTLAAALVPQQVRNDDEETGSTAATTQATEAEALEADQPGAAPEGKLLKAEIEVGGREVPVVGTDENPIRVGDQLELTVSCECTDLLEIPGLGRVEPVSPSLPARFDLLPRRPGPYGIRLLESGRVVARIEVEQAREPKTPGKGS
jgi:hypothetical protein